MNHRTLPVVAFLVLAFVQRVSPQTKPAVELEGAIAKEQVTGDLKAAMGASDHSLLETAEEAEDAAKKAYAEALDSVLPFPIRQLLVTQSAHIQTSHDYVKAARDLTE